MAMTAGDILIERLIGWGVTTIFGLPGDGINGIFEALRTRQDRITFVQVRHEEAAAFAACGYAKLGGKLGVCIATSGPGGIHLLNGLYDAKCDGIPVLAITGHTFHDLIGSHYQQDVNLVALYSDVAVYNEQITGPAHVPNAVDEAIRTALARRGVGHICFPKDIQDWKADEDRTQANIKNHSANGYAPPAQLPSDDLLREAAGLINAGSKVAILAGRGALHCRAEVTELAEKLGAPVVKPLLGKAVLPDDSPLTTGGLGLLGTAASQDVMKACDTLMIVGSSFPYMEFLPKPGQAKCVQIDIDPARIGLRYPTDVGLTGDCRGVLRALLPVLNQKPKTFLETAQKAKQEWDRLLAERADRPEKPLKPQVVAQKVNKYLTDDTVLISDCGTVTSWAARYVTVRGNMQFSASGLLATMANGLPYSLGAAMANPGRPVVCFMGDGGLAMLMGELATIGKYKLPVKIIVIKNNTLGQIKWEQMVFEGNPEFGCDLFPIDFAAVARACGLGGFAVDDPARVDEALAAAFAHDGPALVEATVDPNEPALPGHATVTQAWNLAQSLVRGEKDRGAIVQNLLAQKVREVI